MLHESLDLLLLHPLGADTDSGEHFAQQRLHEGKVLLRFRLVELLECDVARGVGFHVGKSAGEREKVGRVRRVLGEEQDGVQ